MQHLVQKYVSFHNEGCNFWTHFNFHSKPVPNFQRSKKNTGLALMQTIFVSAHQGRVPRSTASTTKKEKASDQAQGSHSFL